MTTTAPPPLTVRELRSRPTLRPDEAFAVLGLRPSTGYTRLADGTIPARRIGKRWIISGPRLADFIEGKSS